MRPPPWLPLLLVAFVILAARLPASGATPSLGDRVGKQVLLVGRVSPNPWQHMIRSDLKKDVSYIDLDGGGQIVAYAKGVPACAGAVLLRGTVLRTEGSSKRPGSKEVCSEIQLDVESWRCLDRVVLEDLVERLATPAVSRSEKVDIEEALSAAGKEAVPVLIAHLKDGRACWKEKVLLNEGELMNRPHNAPPVAERWGVEDVTVGRRCEAILMGIVTPRDYRSPYAANIKSISSASEPFRVEDWGHWWTRNENRSLEQIREGFEPVLDAYWKSHGTQQVVR